MSRKRQFAKYVNSLYESTKLKEMTESVWKDMGVGIPEWPHKDGDAELIVRVGTIPPPFPTMEALHIMRMRLMQKFNQGDPATFVESETYNELLIESTAERGLPQDKMFEDELRETLRLELWELKDFFFKTVNQDRMTGMN